MQKFSSRLKDLPLTTKHHITAVLIFLSCITFVTISAITFNQTKYVQANAAEALSNSTLYDNYLANGWTNWSWDTSINFAYVENTSQAPNKSISATTTNKLGGLYLHTGTGLNPTNYTSVQFKVKALASNQKFSVALRAVNNASIGQTVYFTQIGGNPTVGTWKTYTVPLTTFLKNIKTPIGGFIIQDESGATKQTFIVDDITFVANQKALSPTPSKGITPTPTKMNPTPTKPEPTKIPTPKPVTTGNTPVGINGQLHICGTKICNQYGKAIQLRGMSSHGVQWFYQCMNTASMDALANDWKADVLRISMYVQENGYETDPAGYKTKVDSIIDMTTARGMYAIVDWHILTPGDPNYNLDRAKEYFTYMAQKHGSQPNMIYEIANEPNGVSWATIKNYSEQIIPVIRKYDPDAIIIVGTRGWSSFGLAEGSNSSEIVANPIKDSNVMYSFHFYAASHKTDYVNELSSAADKIPVFVTEWGTQDYTGGGDNDLVNSQTYVDLMAKKQISWTNWNYSDDSHSGASFTVGTCPNGPFAGTSSLKPAGVWIKDRILNPADNFPTK